MLQKLLCPFEYYECNAARKRSAQDALQGTLPPLRVHFSGALIVHSLFSFSQCSIAFVMNYVSLDYQNLSEKFNWHVPGLICEL